MGEYHKKSGDAYLAVKMVNKVSTERPVKNFDAPRYDKLERHNCHASETKANRYVK